MNTECEDCAKQAIGICNGCGLPFCEDHSTDRHGRLECLECAS